MHRQNLPDRNLPTLPGENPGDDHPILDAIFGTIAILMVLACGALALLVGEGGW